ncbi:MAG: UbiH/UbiF/VisC/COQ6 family ubiquinone biosynthesis hydroxylase [Pseudomonadota bacterium]
MTDITITETTTSDPAPAPDAQSDPAGAPDRPREAAADAVIIGGGLVGASLALGLARRGLTSVICDALPFSVSKAPGFDGRGYAVALASRRYLRHLGVWPAIEPHAQEIRDILVSDGRVGEKASPYFLHFDHAELGAEGFGHMLEDHHLRLAVLSAAEAEPLITYWDGAALERLERGPYGATAHLADGRRVTAPIAVACDGRSSGVRANAGIGRIHRRYNQVGLVCAVRHEKPHNGVAHEFFLPPGPFAILPLKGDRSTLVWTERAELAEALRAVDDAVYVSELRRRFGDFLGRVSLEGKRWVYPLSLSLAHEFVKDRLALVGDAARGMHPIAGQGLNYGMRDAAALAETLGDAAERGEDLGELSVLRRYERWRRPDSVAIAAATDGLNNLFSNDLGPVRWARRLGLYGFGQIGPLRRAAMRFAAGDRSDLPAAMRG